MSGRVEVGRLDQVAMHRLVVPARERELLGLAEGDAAHPGGVESGDPPLPPALEAWTSAGLSSESSAK
jgi:hypothetical protein